MDRTLARSDSAATGGKDIDTASAEADREGHILIYTHDAPDAHNLEAVLDLFGFCPKKTFDLDQFKQELEDGSYLTVVITGNPSPSDQEKLAQIVQGSTSHILPIVLYDLPDKETDKLILAYPSHWITMSLPLVSSEFSDALERVKAYINDEPKSQASKRPSHLFRSLTGRSRAIQKIRHDIEMVGPTDATVLILGDSGTGKEVVARNIHYYSKRRGKAFVPVNCGAIPRDLLESELFGHKKGAFTGALTTRDGRFALAEGGTLFLDEIGEMPMDMQVKLLRVLEERTFEPVGDSRQVKADVRIIAATNCNLEHMVKEGEFREDLFFRLEVFPINLPALRERIEDLPLLIGQLNERLEYEKNCSVDFSVDALKALSEYSWPGNVRELANLIERMAIQYPNSQVQEYDLPPKYRGRNAAEDDDGLQLEFFAVSRMPDAQQQSESVTSIPRIPSQGLDLKSYISEIEIKLICQALEDTNGVIAHAAKLLGLRRTTLTEKMRKYGISRPKLG
ncbi:sigma-54 interaction domain-containing protein [Thiolapillus brandeum]|uniref:Sigma-54 specific transcriptional regulator flagellar regulatory protein A n=1 Tax=Thiolapillus brandeum TaxID=1076588 RepID=A0A7U6GIK3_9GAMM|nr:sigma-54 dependent transcriptional regulator [Thiolapillus brandeum]BAO44277.1 sigma-54 specific transcriptional regulator flagellar regulatory protein A [Thiolapillus brandeum]